MLLTILFIFAILVLLLVCVFFVFPWIFGAPYDVTRREALRNVLRLVSPSRGDRIAELGSGDGRVCIALAQANENAKVYGFEINPFLVWISRRWIKKEGLEKRVKIYWKNFWKVNLREFNKIVFFQFRSVVGKLEKKFEQELKEGSKIVSHNWKLPNWKIKKKLGEKGLLEGEVYLYEK